MCCIFLLFFFFKQKTAYEMRISDWSSDVCSSDLARGMDHRHTVFDGDPLRTVFLHIELRAPQAGKNDRLPGKEQAGSVELGENIDGKVELAERLEAGFWIRHGNGKVSAKRDAGARADRKSVV